MGRIKTALVKRTARALYERYRDEFKEDFDSNKAIVSKYIDVSKKMRNIITGFIVRLKKQDMKEKSNTKLNK